MCAHQGESKVHWGKWPMLAGTATSQSGESVSWLCLPSFGPFCTSFCRVLLCLLCASIYLSIYLYRESFSCCCCTEKSSSRCSILHQFYNLQSPINNVVSGVNRRKKRKKRRKVDKSWGQISDDALQHCCTAPYNYRNGVSSLLYTDWVWQHWKDRHTDTQTNGMEQQWSISVRLLLIYERHTERERERTSCTHARILSLLSPPLFCGPETRLLFGFSTFSFSLFILKASSFCTCSALLPSNGHIYSHSL